MSVQFTQQPTVPNFPDELHTAIVVTPEIVAWAQEALPFFLEKAHLAHLAERQALAAGARSWTTVYGPAKARAADHAEYLAELVRLLAAGRNASSFTGWIDQSAWAAIAHR